MNSNVFKQRLPKAALLEPRFLGRCPTLYFLHFAKLERIPPRGAQTGSFPLNLVFSRSHCDPLSRVRLQFDVDLRQKSNKMEPVYKLEEDGSISITLKIKPEGSFLEQEEQIAEALAEVGRLASQLTMKKFDTNGDPIIVKNEKYTSRGEEKKNSKRRGAK